MLYDFANRPLLTSKIGKKEVSSWQERLLFPYLHLISVHIQLYFHLLYVRFNWCLVLLSTDISLAHIYWSSKKKKNVNSC